MERNIRLVATHIAGVSNVLADNLSRGVDTALAEKTLKPQIIEKVFRILYRPEIGLFASSLNQRLPVFCSRRRDLWMPRLWIGRGDAYAFPPLPMLARVLAKIVKEQ
jgi:hypothetical protein